MVAPPLAGSHEATGIALAPSRWVRRFAPRIPPGGAALDLACGSGRHIRHLLARGHEVVAVDRDLVGIRDLADTPGLEMLEIDLEDGRPWPLPGRQFAGIIVTNYLYRPLLPAIVAAVAPGGILVYETFAAGNERLGRPRNPDFLLRPGELLDVVAGHLVVIAYEHLEVRRPRPAMVQRIAASRDIDLAGPGFSQ